MTGDPEQVEAVGTCWTCGCVIDAGQSWPAGRVTMRHASEFDCIASLRRALHSERFPGRALMTWTTEPPTEPGHYWCAEYRPDLKDSPWEVGLMEVWMTSGGPAMVLGGHFIYAQGDGRTFRFGAKVDLPPGPEGEP